MMGIQIVQLLSKQFHSSSKYQCFHVTQQFYSLCILKTNENICPHTNQLTIVQLSSAQLLSYVQLFVTPWTVAHQASLSITNSQSLFKLMSIKSVMPSNHLIPCGPFLLQSSIFPNIRGFSSESVLHKVLEFQFQHQFFQ